CIQGTFFILQLRYQRVSLSEAAEARMMAETVANLIENLIPAIPVRQWVISFPKRIRHYLQTDVILQEVLRVVVDEVRKRVIACSH
ncbi:MAG: hypothetical protein LLG04_16500, partial [Parachlamydia sp.]|nr:hypothetical protein [Parachlamydia sp.]